MTHYGTARTDTLPDPISIREQLFLLAHDEDRNVTPWIDLRALGVGLAAAALLDMMIGTWRLRPSPEPVRSGEAPPPQPPQDPGTAHVQQGLTRVLPAMLREIAPGLYDHTWSALASRGYITTERQWRVRDRFRLADVTPLVRIRGKLRTRIAHPHPPYRADTEALCALIWALNMGNCLIFRLGRNELDALLPDVTARLPDWVSVDDPLASIPDVAEAVRAAVDHLALAAL